MKKLTKKQQAHFDTPDTLVVVSLYPKKGETYSAGTTGVASYTKNLVTNMNRPVIVLADILTKPEVYQENNTLVLRCFDHNDPQLWMQLFKTIRQFKHPKQILLQFDFSMYGSMITSGLITAFLSLLKLFGYKPSVVSHHVVTHTQQLKGHLGLNNSIVDGIKSRLYDAIFQLFYILLGLATHKVILLEETLKHKLTHLIPAHKLVAIPHAVDTSLKTVSKRQARRRLNIPQDEQIVMFFGFANWFKGADLFADYFQNTSKILGKKTRFIIAGGESSTLNDKPYYQQFFDKILHTIYNSKAVSITGYVPQKQIKDYFAAADLVVFPYRYYMCASGVLSLVFSYNKPFIISSALKEMFASDDLAKAFANCELKPTDIQFDLTQKDCLRATKKVLRNGLKQKIRSVGTIMKTERSFANNAKLYEAALFNTQAEPVTTKQTAIPAYEYRA